MNVISIENMWKQYRLGVIGHGTLAEDIQSWWARLRRREDPNDKILQLDDKKRRLNKGAFWALQDINLNIKRGEIFGLIGKNGAGKSTILKIISRVTAPTKGTIKIKGRIASLLEVGTGFHPELTGRENIYLNGTIYGMSRAEISKKLDSIIDFSGVEYHIDTPVKRYSSGMYVRLAFSVAAHLDPEILVVDEVLAVGDIEFQRKCLGKMGSVVKDGRTVLFVSHNMGAIGRLCTECACLEDGRIVYAGKTDKVISYYTGREFEDIGAEQNWKSNPDGNSASSLVLKKAKICQEREVSQCIMINRPFSIQLLLKSFQDIKNLSIGASVTRSDGVVVLHSNKEIDMIHKNGTLSATLSLPAYTMNSGNYTVDIMADIPNERMLIFEERCLRFSVIANSVRMSRYGENAYKGVIGPFIGNWVTDLST